MAKFYITNNGEITDYAQTLLTKEDFLHFTIISALMSSPIAHTPGPAR